MFRVIEQLRKAIASRRDEMAELTAELVSIDTENPPGRNYERCLRFLGERLEPLGFDADIERIDNGNADQDIEMRPVYHQTDERVEAHLFVATLAFLVHRALEKKLKVAELDLSATEHYKRYARSGSSTYSWVLGGLSASSRAAPLAPTRS